MNVQKGKNYRGVVKNYGLVETKKGLPMAVITFGFLDESGVQQEWTWTGTFGSDGAKKRSIATLVTLGFRDGGDPADLCQGPESNLIKIGTEADIVFDQQVYEGKTKWQISFVNPIGGKKFAEAMGKDKAKVAFAGMNLKGEMMAYKQENGLKSPPPSSQGAQPPVDPNDPEIPF